MTDLPPLPETPYVLGREARPYEPEYMLSESGYSDDDMHAYGRACIEADRALRSEWQPIETAPKVHGRLLLLHGSGSGFEKCAYIAAWRDEYQAFELNPEVGWHEPTHWMPLPAPPSDAAIATPRVISE